MKPLNELMILFDDGDHITNEELEFFISELHKVESTLRSMNYPMYDLMRFDIAAKLDRAIDYKKARQHHNVW